MANTADTADTSRDRTPSSHIDAEPGTDKPPAPAFQMLGDVDAVVCTDDGCVIPPRQPQ